MAIRMEEFERHFMDRKLGRGIIRARATGYGPVSIDIQFDHVDRGPQHVQLLAPLGCLESLNKFGDDLLYQLSRMAISQVQQHIRENTLAGDFLELDRATRPWNGDLTEAPYRGATTGYAAPVQDKPVIRRRRLSMAYLRDVGR
jgi:hypothetical protein